MSEPKTYRIKAATDFLQVPPDRREVALKEFGAWLQMLDALAGLVHTPEAFVWVDDGLGEARVSLIDHSTGKPVISSTVKIG
jgi:hypothetical protein